MKKALAFALSLAMVFSMTGCGKKEKETGTQSRRDHLCSAGRERGISEDSSEST